MAKRIASPEVDTEPQTDQLADALSELPSGGVEAVVWRVNPQRRSELDYLVRMPIDEFSLEAIKLGYGGGSYAVRFTDAKGKFTGGWRKFSVSELFKAPADPGTVPVAPAPSSELTELRETVKRLEALVLQGAAPPQRDPFDIAIKMAELMRPQFQAQPMQLAGSEMVTLLKQGMELGRQAAGERDVAPSDPMVEMVKAAQPLLGAVAERIHTESEMKRLQPATAANPAAAAPEVAGPVLPSWLARVRPYLGYIVSLANQGRDPALYADVVIDQLPPPVLGELQQAATAEDFVESTVAVLTQLPQLSTHGKWLGEFLGAIRGQLTEDAEDAAPEEVSETG